MKNITAYVLLLLLLCIAGSFFVNGTVAQEARPGELGARRERINELRKELRSLEALDKLEELERVQKETAAAIRQLRQQLATGEALNSPDNPTPAVGTVNAASLAASPERAAEVTPGSAAVMPGPTQRAVIRSFPAPLARAAYGVLDLTGAALFNPKYARQLIEYAITEKTLRDSDGQVPDKNILNDKDFHCIIHVLRWKKPDPASTSNQPAVDRQNWYVYNNGKAKGFNRTWSQEDFATEKRLFGVKKIWLLYVHLNKVVDQNYQARYEFDITKKAPANLENLFSVASLFVISKGSPRSASTEDRWGGGRIETDYAPSNVTVTAKFVPLEGVLSSEMARDADGQLPPGKEEELKMKMRDAEPLALDAPKVFDNEGRYWWDFSVGFPVRRISELKFESTSNTVTAKEVGNQNLFALLNLYFPSADIKKQTFSWVPHFVGGAAIAKQPQNKILLGAGIGPRFANFYLGTLFVKQDEARTLREGDAASTDAISADVRRRYKPQFTFGLNLPVRGVIEALKPKDNSK